MTSPVAYATRRVEWSPGVTINVRMAASLRRVQDRLGYELTVIQGCYHPGVGASAGTHDYGGAVDLAPFDYSAKVAAMRREGWAAWHRPTLPGYWGEHIHCMMIGDPDIPPGSLAAEQVAAYYLGFDGLGYMGQGGRDSGPRFVPIPQTPLTMEDFVPYTDWPQGDQNALDAHVRRAAASALDDFFDGPINLHGDGTGSEIEFRGVTVRDAIKAAARGHVTPTDQKG